MKYEKKLSILLVTYNHEKYIKAAIDSILMQKLDYDYEIVVADDCSSDNTLKIIEEYKMTYKDKFKILENEKNLGITKNYKRGFSACRGEYIAVLEGDDYWVNNKKLQKQIDFLTKHSECALVFNRFEVYDMSNNTRHAQPWFSFKSSQITNVKELIKSNFIGNFSTCMYRNELIQKIDPTLYEMVVYDWMLNIVLAQSGLIGYLPRVMSVYRLNPNGTWSQKSEIDKIKSTIENMTIYDEYLKGRFTEEFTEHKNRLLDSLKALSIVPEEYHKPTLRETFRYYTPEVIIDVIKFILPKKILDMIKQKPEDN